MKRLFGTDGIRSVAGRPPLDPPTVRRFGAALADVLARDGASSPKVVLGRDTRESGPWLRDAVASGVAARGGSAVDAGVLTTPGLAFAVGAGRFDAGVMISASHNPYEDNGLKVFTRDGTKLPDAAEVAVEEGMLAPGAVDPGERAGSASPRTACWSCATSSSSRGPSPPMGTDLHGPGVGDGPLSHAWPSSRSSPSGLLATTI